MSRDLLLHIFIVLFPLYIYQIFLFDRFFRKYSRWNRLFIGILGGVAASANMMLPMHLSGYLMWGFSNLSIIFVTLYGGYTAWIAAVVIEVGYRVFFAGANLNFTLLETAIISMGVFFFIRRFYYLNRMQKMLTALTFTCIAYAIELGRLYFLLGFQEFRHLLIDNAISIIILGVVQLACMGLAIFLVESMFETAIIRIKLQRSEKLNMIGELAASIAHEVRNPLTVVHGFLQLLKSSVPEDLQKHIALSLQELERTESILSDYLNFARPQVSLVEEYDLRDILKNTLMIMGSYALMKNVQMQEECETGIFVRGDRHKIEQAFMNLLKNSIEAGASKVVIRGYEKENHVMIDISDDGHGMTAETLNRLGEPFYSIKTSGTGLGLMVTFRLIEAMGGELKFRSEFGKGTDASIILPSAKQLKQFSKGR